VGKVSLVITGSGTAALLDKFKMRIFNLKFSSATDRPKAEIVVENVVAQLYEQYSRRLKDDHKFEAIVMGLEGFDKGEANIMRVHGEGISQCIKTYAIVGHGNPYIAALYSILYNYELSVIELAVLGCFCLRILVSTGLDQRVGLLEFGPECVILKTNGKPYYFSQGGKEFSTARKMLDKPQLRSKLAEIIWNEIPSIFKMN